MSKHKRVAITGIGPVASPGIGKDSFWEGVLSRRTGLGMKEVTLGNEVWESFPAHTVETFDFGSFDLDKTALAYMAEWKEEPPPVDLCYLIAAVDLALHDSGLRYEPDDNNIGLVLAHENLGLMPFLLKVSETAYDALTEKGNSFSRRKFHEKLYRDCLKSGYDVQSFMTLFHVAKIFNIHGYSLFVNNACASGLYALESAAQMIRNNQNSAVVVAASDESEIYKYFYFRDIDLYSRDGMIRPFSRNSSGFVFGDGGIGIVLEDLEQAWERNADIYAEYVSGGFSLEGWKVSTPQIGSSSYQNAITRALDIAGVQKDEIQLLVPHGVGSHAIDYYESRAITDIFGASAERPFITTFKPYVGHNLGGSALLETAILLLSMSSDMVVPTLNCDNSNPDFGISLVKEEIQTTVNTAMKICCAFAGYNAAAIFKRPDAL